tara:strand:- start:167 stop:493 length:327 start_codon:yes stop_codon:yes gene_type:complete
MSDLFDDFNKIFKKDLLPIFVKFLKDPNNKITDNLNNFLNDPQRLLTDLFDGFLKNKDDYNKSGNFTDIENVTDIDPVFDNEYDDLFKRLIVIEDSMIQIQKILKDEN